MSTAEDTAQSTFTWSLDSRSSLRYLPHPAENASFLNTFWWEVGFALCFMGPVHHQVTKAAKA